MKYENIKPALFLSRPNRFVADIKIDGGIAACHVKNTGRCKELLLPGARVFVSRSNQPKRRTKYDLISVYKGSTLVNIDSQAPNKVVAEWLRENGLNGEPLQCLRPESPFGRSRMDFYAETVTCKYLIEVKGVTLEQDGVAKFPDAPTQRGVRHLHELIKAREQGFQAMVLFVIQMDNVCKMTPNWQTHAEFGEALRLAQNTGVHILAMDCDVTADSLKLRQEIPVSLEHPA